MDKHINELMINELMIITMEECGELIQECSKTIRKDEPNNERLLEEAGDVYCMIQLMIKNNLFSYYDLELRAKEKTEKLKKWSSLIE